MTMQNFWDIVREVIEESDVVIEVLDARMPEETRNRKAEKMTRIARKPLILVVNKADMISMSTVRKHREVLDNVAPCIFVSTKNRRGITFLKKKIFELIKKRSRKDLKRRYRRNVISIGIIGYPNTGKSSLINALAGRKKAKVAAKPGWTRGIQWISGGPGIRLIDTPGVIPVVEEDEVKQALIGVLDSTKISDPEMVAKKIIEIFLEQNRKGLEKLYGIKTEGKRFNGIVREIGKSRGMLKKGGVIDNHRVWLTVINDWQRGKLLVKG